MHPIIQSIRQRASQLHKTIALPEANDERILRAAVQVHQDQIAQITLVGDPPAIRAQAGALEIDLAGVGIINPQDAQVQQRCAQLYSDCRPDEKLDEKELLKRVGDPLDCATLLLRDGQVDGVVAGSIHSTAQVLRTYLRLIGCAVGTSTVSSCLIMTTPHIPGAEEAVFVFADCGVIPQPTAEQLADIAVATARSARLYLQTQPRVAMLSFSTKGSADHPDVQKVVEATRIAQANAPDLLIDGELQADAALLPEVAASKDPEGKLSGRANVLIFPDLDAGNIGYKLVRYLGGGEAYGPLVQGLARAGMDLSRAATVEEIVNVIAVAALRATALENEEL